MITKISNRLLVLLSCATFFIGCMEQELSSYTTKIDKHTYQLTLPALALAAISNYHKQEITPDTIVKLVPQLDKTSKQAIKAWLGKNKPLINILINFPFYAEKEIQILHSQLVAGLMKLSSLENMSKHNFVVVITGENGKKYVLKMAGPVNRKENYNALLQQPYGTPMSLERYQALKKDGLQITYQTISRAAHFLRLKEWVENHKTKITTPYNYLVHIPGQPKEVNDANYVVVEDWVESIGTPDDHPKVFLDTADDNAEAIAYTGLWNIASRQFLITPDLKIAYIDLEQPNNSNPIEFFHKNKEKYQGNVHCGLGELAVMLKELETKVQEKK